MEEQKKSQQKIKKQNTLQRVLSIVTDIFLYPVIIAAMIIGCVMIGTRSKSQTVSVFGISVVKVLSQSMVAAGYDVGDVVILKSTDAKKIEVGDIIAFYNYRDPSDPSKSKLGSPIDTNNPPEVESDQRVCGTTNVNDAIKSEAMIVFHRIVAVYQASDGTRFFETKGDSNGYIDSTLIREDFVVGVDAGMPKWILNVFSFCFSTKGIVFLVIVPLGILIFFQLLEIFELISALMLEKKVLTLEVPFDSPESIKNNIGFEMREFDKVYFYDIMHDNRKSEVKDFLWGHLYDPQNRRERKQLEFVETGLAFLPDRNQYWNYFIQNAKLPSTRKRMINLQTAANSINLGRQIEIKKANSDNKLAPKTDSKIEVKTNKPDDKHIKKIDSKIEGKKTNKTDDKLVKKFDSEQKQKSTLKQSETKQSKKS